jgi:formylglycine-generating enzyme required for sulfatase activity
MMGSSPDSDENSEDNESLHQVELSSFWMSATEVTWWQYHLFCRVTGHEEAEKPGWGGEGGNPVVNVSWNDAVLYSNWLSERMGRVKQYSGEETIVVNPGSNGYRLPTESEWEYAARGGVKRRGSLYAGSDTLENVGWYGENSGSRTHSVGGKLANELGLYDMSGNVWEWCWDWYGDYDDKASTNPQGAESGDGRVYRGGGWGGAPRVCRAADRNYSWPSYRGGYLGFRLVSPLQ